MAPTSYPSSFSQCPNSRLCYRGQTPTRGNKSKFGPDPQLLTIPTRVGKTPSPVIRRSPTADHPHTRGENSLADPLLQQVVGPSPHAWGKLSKYRRQLEISRTIPTRVGKTAWWRFIEGTGTDHPHTRAWGKRYGDSTNTWSTRTIPTRVGKTARGAQLRGMSTDHPHTRGENF